MTIVSLVGTPHADVGHRIQVNKLGLVPANGDVMNGWVAVSSTKILPVE